MNTIKITLLAIISLFVLSACGNGENEKIATVNDAVITKGQLHEALMKQYGTEVLESLMTNEIILQEAAKNDIVISDEQLQEEYAIYADYYGGEEALLESMKTFRMSEEDIKLDIKIYLLTMQLLSKEISMTDEEIQAYYDENKTSYVTDDGEQLPFESVKEEVEADYTEAKVNEIYDDWLDEKFEEFDIKTYFKE